MNGVFRFMKLSQMPYEHIDMDKVKAFFEKLIQDSKNAGSGEEQFELHKKYYEFIGDIYTNVGVAFYKDGKIKSLEPVLKTRIEINGKPVYPFCFFANHMHADNNSLVFDESGMITSFYGQQREETKCQKKVI